MAESVYVLCGLTSLMCSILLARGYLQSRMPLLLWSAICFAGLTVNNVLLVVDKVALPNADLSTWRTVAALVGLLPLLYGMIWDSD